MSLTLTKPGESSKIEISPAFRKPKSTLQLHAEAAARGEDFTAQRNVRFVQNAADGEMYCAWHDISFFLDAQTRAMFSIPLANLKEKPNAT